ncbi:MAG: nitroreductase family protein [candidate division WOR-3 bacterium]
MELKEVIEKRRAYRSLKPCEINEEMIRDIAGYASLAPSCYNNQPWRFVFVYEKDVLEKIFETLPEGNSWAKASSMIIAVFSKKEFDCVIGNREYYLFDTGMATAFLILRLTDLDLVAHPIAGYDEDKVKEILKIPKDMIVITLIIVGKKADQLSPILSERHKKWEEKRPERLKFEEFCGLNEWSK